MNILGLSISKRKVETRSLDVPQDVDVCRIGAPMQPISVRSTEQAMRLSTAYRCSDILSGTIASIPLLIKRRQGGYFSVDETNELYSLLTRKASSRMNSYDTMLNAITQMLNQGNAYIVIRRKFGDISELILCSNNTVAYDELRNMYTISDPYNSLSGVYTADEVIHLRNKSLDGGRTGVSVITYASTVLSVAASADNQSLRTFQNGNKIKGLVSGVQGGTGRGLATLNGKQLTDVADRINNQFNMGRDIVAVDEELAFQQLSISPADAQLLETKKFSVFDICRFYGVHPDKVFAGQSTNYKASEMSQVLFLADTLQPILCKIEAEFISKLIPDSVAHLYKIEFDRNALYQTDLTTKSLYMEKQIQYGASTINEWRMSEGRAPIEGGDEAMISCNVAPIGSAKIRGEKIEPPKTE